MTDGRHVPLYETDSIELMMAVNYSSFPAFAMVFTFQLLVECSLVR